MNKSIDWVSTLKFFGIIAVILGHIANPFGSFIYSWHMPLFFMIAGFFIKTEGALKDLLIKDWKRLMLPYFIFSMFALMVTSLKLWGLHREPLIYLNELWAIFFWMDYKHLINTYAFVLWFLPALFFAKFLYYIINKNSSNLLLKSGLFIFLFWISFKLPTLPFALNNAINSVIWLFIGSQIFIFFKVARSPALLAITIFIALGGGATIYINQGIPKLDMSSLIYDNQFVNVLWSVSLLLLLISLLKVLPKNGNIGIVEQWGGATMILFILHPYTNNISHLFIEKLGFGSWPLKLLLSLGLLQLILIVKNRFSNSWIFKYV